MRRRPSSCAVIWKSSTPRTSASSRCEIGGVPGTPIAALASSLLAAEYLAIRLARRSSPPCARRPRGAAALVREAEVEAEHSVDLARHAVAREAPEAALAHRLLRRALEQQLAAARDDLDLGDLAQRVDQGLQRD